MAGPRTFFIENICFVSLKSRDAMGDLDLGFLKRRLHCPQCQAPKRFGPRPHHTIDQCSLSLVEKQSRENESKYNILCSSRCMPSPAGGERLVYSNRYMPIATAGETAGIGQGGQCPKRKLNHGPSCSQSHDQRTLAVSTSRILRFGFGAF